MRIVYIYIFLFVLTGLNAQHYPLSTHYVVNGAVINPAYAGRNNVLDVTVAHRRQWVGVNGAPVNSCFSMNAPLKRKELNIGLSVLDDRISVFSTQLFNVMFAYRIKLDKVNIAFGIQNGLMIQKANLNSLARNDQQDNLLSVANPNKSSYVAGSGIYLHSKYFFAGLSMPYMVNTVLGSNFIETPIILNAGYYLHFSSEHSIRMATLARSVDGSPIQAEVGASYYYKSDIGLGLNYRSSKSVIATLELGINKQTRIYYGYEYNTGEIRRLSSGTHELALRYYFGYYTKATNPRDFR